jgi:cold shock CspA family protein
MNTGILKSWNDEKGFGFIQSEIMATDVFIHVSTLKAMSRAPKVGDTIYFDIEQQADGKISAKNCKIHGVLAKSRPKPRRVKQQKSRSLLYLFIALIVGIFSVSVYQSLQRYNNVKLPSFDFAFPESEVLNNSNVNFSCDGRRYCSQMNSRAEAKYFLINCPDTLMDGDKDGIPCENDSRF